MKKYVIIILTLILIAIACIFTFKNYNKPTEDPVKSMGAIESAINNAMLTSDEPVETAKEEAKEENVEPNNAPKETKKVSVIKKAVKKVQEKLLHESTPVTEEQHPHKEIIQNTSAETEQSKFTPEEEELLKKIPRTDEVVVDKEIKVKSSGKYLFK